MLLKDTVLTLAINSEQFFFYDERKTIIISSAIDISLSKMVKMYIQWGTDKSTPGFKGKEPNTYHGRMFETDFGRHRIQQYWWTTCKGNKNKRTEGTLEVCLWVSNDRVLFQQKRLLGHTFLLWPAVHLSYPRNIHSCLSLVSHRALVHKPESEALETC